MSQKNVPPHASPNGSRRALYSLKAGLRAWLLKAGGIRHIHIVGCARSGTTMLHYCMVAFEHTLLVDRETSVAGYPSLRQSAALFGRRVLKRPALHIVTKRDYGWFSAAELDRLVEQTLREEIGIINIVRDPRDVLTSFRTEKTGRYVKPERWRASVEAADRLFARLDGYPRKLTVRYEDVVTSPAATEDQLARTFGLEKRPGVDSIATLKDNLERLHVDASMASYMHTIRNFDPSTIGRWQRDPKQVAFVDRLLTDSPIASELGEFMRRYRYLS